METKMLLPKGKVLSFWVSHSEIPELKISILHSTDAEFVEYCFYVILEPQTMSNIDSLGEYYGSFDVSPEHQNRIIHVFKQLYRDEKSNIITDTVADPDDVWADILHNPERKEGLPQKRI